MNCPLCKTHALAPVELESQLQAYRCEHCGGAWIEANDYLAWLKEYGPPQPATPAPEGPIAVLEIDIAKLCPADGHILLKYKIGHDIPFALDRCSTCNGVWFDPHEWEALKQRTLHDEVNSIFTEPWQRRVREEEHRRTMRAIYLDRFGEKDYAELRRIKAWLDGHPQQGPLLAYLSNPNPYKR